MTTSWLSVTADRSQRTGHDFQHHHTALNQVKHLHTLYSLAHFKRLYKSFYIILFPNREKKIYNVKHLAKAAPLR